MLKKIVGDFGLLVLSVIIFLGGILILSLKIPFWSLFFGLASVQIGIVLIILTFDSFIRQKTKSVTEDYKTLSCLVCGKLTFVPKYSKVTICDEDQIKIARTFKASLFGLFTLITISTTLLLLGQNQELRKKAYEPVPSIACEFGVWFPESCRCGFNDVSLLSKCENGFIPRVCSDSNNYCCRLNQSSGRTDCQLINP
ncbi:hypothetical protein A3D00_05575 [Candidatus Woesebacteria bacterium RIFCSPHIGHO2_02_FULL_38_9]|uniref:Uncharacterized protein n=1 Tax=Candidatus Woesebacteria bacterium RIFCSPHIGHO2_01_FULL_39_28 TaxID=1802496 RepID=A0A1F7YIS1_9BACT|nr:MAG: hypothetical protein A2627_05955 [Candidatus Woesebacteria bacterium RIFCSPHIGHO2_01_FULL_39_28]OGM32024.1 MAG: hypothetical protein A3D00_05575 [Candidatus Woesebacteria bacterium RIFCSPHIGHO2_02_FULL_38_9]OGM57131.1 MAG: hypothetical protein A3A50_00365 [Candidatus Woesebacteria bacterium RIFCSPLOWO2_01_FULL_38_20]